MEEKTSGSNVAAEQPASKTPTTTAPSAETAGTEHRQAYGTAKTENLRDNGLWRIILPALIIIFCLTLLCTTTYFNSAA